MKYLIYATGALLFCTVLSGCSKDKQEEQPPSANHLYGQYDFLGITIKGTVNTDHQYESDRTLTTSHLDYVTTANEGVVTIDEAHLSVAGLAYRVLDTEVKTTGTLNGVELPESIGYINAAIGKEDLTASLELKQKDSVHLDGFNFVIAATGGYFYPAYAKTYHYSWEPDSVLVLTARDLSEDIQTYTQIKRDVIYTTRLKKHH
ncbi:hypothetical protein [Flavihumibacter petaseus]|uniref:Uncharacterized protein n=1 Tax=Flavihumibacter petaseus NBRC 106054 TaxID=1220578 RepID=A0A0E9N1L1_9BACT|nr:hypothetical protein [Flavihumibacter petaseus]GAO43230.1 hypothetical protein FPE01S_02_03340 [Flavihumibacter petaseus NBRC 106054]